MTGSAPQTLRSKISLGVMQHFGANLVVRALAVLSIAVLGRLLVPADFGIFAYAVFVSTLAETVFFRHFHMSLIRLPEVTEAHLHTLVTLRLLTGVLLAAGIALLAAPVAIWVATPALEPVLYVMAVAQIIATFVSPRFMMLEKEMRFAPAAFQLVLIRMLTTLSALTLGFAVGNHWALVTGLILMPIIAVLHAHWVAPYRPRFSLEKWRDFALFGLWVSFGTLLNFLSLRIDRLILGPTLGMAMVGIYRMGVDLAELGAQQLAQPMDRAIYPALTAKNADRATLARAYLSTQTIVIGVVLPMGLLTALCGPEILRILAGPQWLGAAPVIQVLAPLIALNTLEGGVRALLYVRDAPKRLFFRNLLVLVLTVPIMFLGVTYGGFLGVILAAAVTKMLALVLILRLAGQETDQAFFAPFIRSWRSFVSGFGMVAVVLMLGQGLPAIAADTAALSTSVLNLAVKLGGGLVSYLGLHGMLWMMAGRPDGIESFALGMLARGWARLRRRRADVS